MKLVKMKFGKNIRFSKVNLLFIICLIGMVGLILAADVQLSGRWSEDGERLTLNWNQPEGEVSQVEYSHDLLFWTPSPTGRFTDGLKIAEWTDIGWPSTAGKPNDRQQRYYRVVHGSKTSMDTTNLLWAEIITPYLESSLWKPRDAVDASERLTVPLHAAFRLARLDWQHDFDNFFDRYFAAYPKEVDTSNESRLSRLSFHYFTSRYLVLTASQERADAVRDLHAQMIAEDIRQLWNVTPAWMWERSDFVGMRERLLWKVENKNVSPQYFRALFDEELFLIAIAADLTHYFRLRDIAPDPAQADILNWTKLILSKEIKWGSAGGWLLQPGVWHEHPDYAYAGNGAELQGLNPSPVEGIASDSSHSMRWPLWLVSLAEAFPPDSEDNLFYTNLQFGLETQFVSKVLVPPTPEFRGFRTHNFMDGRNGVYRYNLSLIHI